MPLSKKEQMTIKDIYDLPDGQRAELFDGQIYYMAPPGRKHQEIVGELYRIIANFILSQNGSCKPYVAPFAVFLNKDDKTYVEPDISVICDDEILSDRGCEGAPDWIIEVVSPSSQRIDYLIKLFKYRTAGVKEYWIVDPKDRTVSVYDFANDNMEKYTFAEPITSKLYSGLKIDFSRF